MNENYQGPYYKNSKGLPEDYRKALVELMSFQADSEFMGGLRVYENLRFAPRPEEALRLAKKVKEEFGHGVYLWNLLRDLGVDVDSRLQALVQHPKDDAPGGTKIINAFKYKNWSLLFDCWEDVAIFSTIVTPGAAAFLGQYKDSSYLPWAEISERIFKEEMGHLGFGVWAARRVLDFGGESGRTKLQKSVEKFMPIGMGFYGRDSKDSHHFQTYYKFGLKTKMPEILKHEYLSLVKSRLDQLGLDFPSKVVADYEMDFKQ